MDRPRHPSLPFDIAVIVSQVPEITRLSETIGDLREPRIALVMRDPEHRAEAVLELAGHAVSHAPSQFYLIASGYPAPGIHAVQLPFALLGDAPALSAAGIPFGVSVHCIEELRAAERAGASWVFFSPIFATPSKPGLRGVGLAALRDVCSSTTLPVCALGGIDLGNALRCIEAGAQGIAGIRLLRDAGSFSLLADLFRARRIHEQEREKS